MCNYCDTRAKFIVLHPIVTVTEKLRQLRVRVHKFHCRLTSHRYGVAYRSSVGAKALMVCHRCGGREVTEKHYSPKEDEK
jgi:hypothetical protein